MEKTRPAERVLKNTGTLDEIAEPLLRWFKSEKRALPWREESTPYRVWVSEIMLQQTRVEAVKPYFERFVAALPDVRSLAQADEDMLMKLWEGLGYYSRARHLQSAARLICSDHGGKIPARFDDLLTLPGIGRYTAGAVASIAFGERRPAVDGNVLRVIMRLLACPADILKESTKRAVEEALIARLPEKTPPKRRRTEKLTIFLLAKNDKIALEKRPAQGLLAGLWGFPAMEGHLKKKEAAEALRAIGLIPAKLHALPAAQHIFSHITWQMVGWHVELAETSSDEPSAATKSSPASTEAVEANARPASLCLHEATAPYDAQTKTPPLLWATAQEIADIYSVPAAYRSYFPYLQAPDRASS